MNGFPGWVSPSSLKVRWLGVIALEKTEAGFYKDEHIQVITTFAGQAAVALENATLFQESLQRTTELDQRSQRLALLNRFSNQISSVLEPNYILETTLQELSQALETTTVSAFIWENNQLILMSRISYPDRSNLSKYYPMHQSLNAFNKPLGFSTHRMSPKNKN